MMVRAAINLVERDESEGVKVKKEKMVHDSTHDEML